MTLEDAVILLYSLRRGRSNGHEKPHKPVLLLAIMDLVELGEIRSNQIPPSDRLRSLFRTYFEIVKQGNDQCSPELPFYHLSGEAFWSLYPKKPDASLSWGRLQELVQHAVIETELFALMINPLDRELMREAIISRYFAKHRDAIRSVCRENTQSKEPAVAEDPKVPGRDGGFRKIITEVYDHRCAACGLRIYLDQITLVEAAHLVPYAVTHDDNPRNGMALCRNHHYAMDRHLIAPCPDNKWRVSTRLDRRRDGEAKLLEIDGLEILLPKEKQFYPDESALRWRCDRLLA
jgi:putative restriction endonuclease